MLDQSPANTIEFSSQLVSHVALSAGRTSSLIRSAGPFESALQTGWWPTLECGDDLKHVSCSSNLVSVSARFSSGREGDCMRQLRCVLIGS